MSSFVLRQIPIVTIFLVLGTGCPLETAQQPTLDYTGLVFDASEFWPFETGNYWLWLDPESPTEWVSMKVLKAMEIAGVSAYLVEIANTVGGGGRVWTHNYYVVHPKGLFRSLTEEQLLRWAETPDDMSLLIPVLEGEFIRGTVPYPAVYDEHRQYSVDSLQELVPFDQCPEDDPLVVNGDAGDFIVLAGHTVLLTHTAGLCGNASRARIVYGCYALDVGPIVWPGWRKGTLVRAIVGEQEYAL